MHAGTKRIRVGVVGAGYLGRFHAEKYSGLGPAELVAVVDTDAARAEAVSARHGAKSYSSYPDIIGKVDAVSIVTPTETHFEIAGAFLSAGVDVLLEKPMTTTIAEADALIDLAGRSGAILQIGHLERFNPAVVALGNRLAAPMFIEAHRLSPFPERNTDVDVVLDLMIHDIDIVLNLVKSDIEWVDAAGVPIITDKADIVNARIRFESGCVANITASRVSMEPQRRMRLFQSDAYIAIDFMRQRMTISRRVMEAGAKRPAIASEDLHIEPRDTLLDEISRFIECCATRKDPLVSGRDGRRALEAAVRIQESVSASSMERFRERMRRKA